MADSDKRDERERERDGVIMERPPLRLLKIDLQQKEKWKHNLQQTIYNRQSTTDRSRRNINI